MQNLIFWSSGQVKSNQQSFPFSSPVASWGLGILPTSHWTKELSPKKACETGADPGGGAIAPLKPTKVTLFAMIVYNSEKTIRDIWPFCPPLFCHSSAVKYTTEPVLILD